MNWLIGILGGIIGLAFLALCIQNRTRMARWLASRRTARVTARATTVATGTPQKAKSDGFKKVLETSIALAKLAALLAITGGLFVFIVGPTKFWDQPMVIQQVPVQGAVTAQQTATPQSRTITVPAGDFNALSDKWSEEVKAVSGWSFRWDVTGQGGKIGVLVDGTTKVISEPGKRADTHATQSLRFISLEGRPINIAVSYYR